jgi:hypothetical protein
MLCEEKRDRRELGRKVKPTVYLYINNNTETVPHYLDSCPKSFGIW